jgi:hypothetical protein
MVGVERRYQVGKGFGSMAGKFDELLVDVEIANVLGRPQVSAACNTELLVLEQRIENLFISKSISYS